MKKHFLICFASLLCVSIIFSCASCGMRQGTEESSSTSSSSSSSSSSSLIIADNGTSSSESETTDNTPMDSTGGLIDTKATLPIFARFDFGTKSKAEENSLTSHEYILSILEYDADALSVTFTEDSMILTALLDGTFEAAGDQASLADSDHFIRGTKTCYRPMNTFAVKFDNMVTFDFDDELRSGYGMWHNFPFTYDNMINDENWRGYHQFMKIRIKNPTDNSAIAMQFNNSTAFASTQFAVMSVGADKPDYTSYIYDLCYASTYPSGKGVLLAGSNPGNNWTWKQNIQVIGLRFHLLGSTCSYANAYLNNVFDEGESAADYDAYYEYFKRLDTRAAIKKGNSVEIDYIVFGSDPKDLYNYHSNIETATAEN
ncbi:MAG: hypothetical protein IJR55_06270 [Clostridia bacterium]|nr:hypothetical protein [Clostridia bacterium]